MSFKVLNDSIEPSKNHAFYLTPSYKKTRGDNGENGSAYGFNLGFATAIDDRQNLALSLSYQKAKDEYDLADFNSNYVNFGLNHVLDAGAFKILSGVSLGGGKNDFEREILGTSKLNGSYKNLFLTATLGVSKAFEFGDFSLLPLGYFGYNFIRQNAFSESGAVFAKEFEAINHHSTLLGTGVNLNHTQELENAILQLGGFVIFERRLSGANYDTKVRFKDFDDSYFTQKYELNKNLLTLGLNSQIDFKNGAFFRLNLANEIAKTQKSVSIFATLGYKF
ncbi:autotransporter outer membrane beta-barrel domain-containing protein [Campylobacter sp. PS10]|uniref:Autotransporter outer membrane beta-barrel domain-containing protein n=2 Tax=Campylobacter gastrosuis TaxID=2974576 RepID=A0ABT7HQF3_9BACT|nr:autotransporter outer membrane beta-barrel domain-containing protein [Campylobacter gastrosuis]